MKGGVFKQSYHFDNGLMTDDTGKLLTKAQLKEKHKSKTTQQSQLDNSSFQSTRAQSTGTQSIQARLRNTNQKFENQMNKYATFLDDKTELPRLSILDNYK